jgi:hypothetical protein
MGHRLARAAAPALIVIASYLMVWPTFHGQRWALLDDPNILSNSMQTLTWAPHLDVEQGRYRPLYWLWYALQYRAFHLNVEEYYIVHATVLVVTNLLLYAIVRWITGSIWLGLLAVALMLSGTPVPESFYTLHKPEPLQVGLLLAGLWGFLRAAGGNDAATRRRGDVAKEDRPGATGFGRFWVGVSAVCFLAAYLVKETTLLVLPAALLMWAGAWWLNRRGLMAGMARSARLLVMVNALALLVFIVLAYPIAGTRPPWQGKYTKGLINGNATTQPTVADTGAGSADARVSPPSAIKTYWQVSPDVVIGAALCVLGFGMSLRRIGRYGELELLAATFTAASGAFFVFHVVIWRWAFAYYVLPVEAMSIIAIVLWLKSEKVQSAECRVQSAERRTKDNGPLTTSAMAALALLVGGIAWMELSGVPKVYSSAVALKAWNRANGQALDYVMRLPAGDVVLLNYDKDFEYVHQLRRYREMLMPGRPVYFGSAWSPQDWLEHARRGSKVLVNYGEPANAQVTGRALQAPSGFQTLGLIHSAAPGLQIVDEDPFAYEAANVLFPWSLQKHEFGLGWVSYRIKTLPHLLSDRPAAPWMARQAQFWVKRQGPGRMATRLHVEGRALDMLPLPAKLQMFAGETKISQYTIDKPDLFSWTVDLADVLPSDARTFHFTIKSDSTFVPDDYLHNGDRRVSSVMIYDAYLGEKSTYDDDVWMGRMKQITLQSQGPASTVVIDGAAVPLESIGYPIKLELWTEQGSIGEYVVKAPGDFTWRIELPRSVLEAQGSTVVLQLWSDKIFSPLKEIPGNTDQRELSVMIKGVKFADAPRLYPDRWMGRAAQFELRRYGGEVGKALEVRGQALPIPGVKFPIVLEAWGEKGKVGTFAVKEAGEFVWRIDWPDDGRDVKLRLVSGTTFVPRDLLGNEDARELSVMIEGVRFVKKSGEE